MMSEGDAKKMWCPFGRMAHPNGGGYNRNADGHVKNDCRCVGSGCMAWRWQKLEFGDDSKPTLNSGGYCGLAGMPPP